MSVFFSLAHLSPFGWEGGNRIHGFDRYPHPLLAQFSAVRWARFPPISFTPQLAHSRMRSGKPAVKLIKLNFLNWNVNVKLCLCVGASCNKDHSLLLSLPYRLTGLESAPPVVLCSQPVVGGACWAPPTALPSAQAMYSTMMMSLIPLQVNNFVKAFVAHTKWVYILCRWWRIYLS